MGAVAFTKVHAHEKSQSQQILRVLGNLQRLLRLEKRLPGTFLLDLMSHKRQNKALPVSPIYLDSIERLQVTGVSSLGVPRVPWHTQILADQLTLFQPGGTDYAAPYYY